MLKENEHDDVEKLIYFEDAQVKINCPHDPIPSRGRFWRVITSKQLTIGVGDYDLSIECQGILKPKSRFLYQKPVLF